MFRVVGRDALGRRKELSICASTEEEARVLAQGEGLVAIGQVSIPPPHRPARFLKLSGFAVGVLVCLGCFGFMVLGAVIGGIIATPEAVTSDNILMPVLMVGIQISQWLRGVVIGAVVGLICGAVILTACYRNYWKRR